MIPPRYWRGGQRSNPMALLFRSFLEDKTTELRAREQPALTVYCSSSGLSFANIQMSAGAVACALRLVFRRCVDKKKLADRKDSLDQSGAGAAPRCKLGVP